MPKIYPVFTYYLQESEDKYMGYCFMSIDKIKTGGKLRAKYNHNYRMVDVSNADPDKKHLNEELVSLPITSSGNKKDFNQIFLERKHEIEMNTSRRIRKDAVRALEIVTTFSRSENIDIEKWKSKNIDWLKTTFNVAGDNKDNVISVMYHADEAGNVHCHAIVIPVDEKGHLNASRFIDGSRTLANMQTSYAESMKEFGLMRGLENSSAKHTDIRRFYTELNRSMAIPEPFDNETAIEYHDRISEDLENRNLALLKKQKDTEQKYQRRLDYMKRAFDESLKKELENIEKSREFNLAKLQDEIRTKSQELERLSSSLFRMEQQLTQARSDYNYYINKLNTTESEIELLRKKAGKYDKIESGFRILKESHPQKANEIEHTFSIMEELLKQKESLERETFNDHNL